MSRPTANFDSNDLASSVPGLIVTGTSPHKFPTRNLSTGPIANANKSVTSSAFYADKKPLVHIEIGENTRELLDDAMDKLYSILQAIEAVLILSVGSGTRQWTATLDNVNILDMQGGWAQVDVEFEATTPYGTDINSTTLFSNNLSGASNSANFVVYGSAYFQVPIITITYTALTGGTAKTVTVGNSANGQVMTITRNWAVNDVLVIDSLNKKVTVNGVEIAPTGGFPEWQSSMQGVAGSMDYSDNFTTRIRQTTAIYYKRYV